MLIQCYMGLAWEEEHTTVRGETGSGFQQKQLFLPAQENLLAENSAGGIFFLEKKRKSSLQKKGPILLGYNQSSMPFKRRKPKSCFNPCPPKPACYTSPQQGCNAASLECSNQPLAHVNVHCEWLSFMLFSR